MKTYIIKDKENGKKINTVLLQVFPTLSLNTLYKALRKKDIKVNQKRIHENIFVYTGDTIELYLPDEVFSEDSISIPIIYEDEHIIAFYKPAGIETTGNLSLTTLVQRQYSSSLEPCHRLDRNTTGLVLFAKDKATLSILLDKFKRKEIEKHYLCKVYGIPSVKKQVLVSYLFKDAKKSLVYISDEPKKGYQKIITSYQVVQTNLEQNTAILDVTLHTGRTHQIRAHLAHIGFPIIGDGKYGSNEINRKFHYSKQQLCSYQLTFSFSTASGLLNYLNGLTITLEKQFLEDFYE